jgi:hypothetical protein
MKTWLLTKKPGQQGGEWPEALDWPENMPKNLTSVHTRWKKLLAAETAAAGAAGAAPSSTKP